MARAQPMDAATYARINLLARARGYTKALAEQDRQGFDAAKETIRQAQGALLQAAEHYAAMQPRPVLTLEQAVEVLNRVGHNSADSWTIFPHGTYAEVGCLYHNKNHTLTPFEAIALATYYETQGLTKWPGFDWKPEAAE